MKRSSNSNFCKNFLQVDVTVKAVTKKKKRKRAVRIIKQITAHILLLLYVPPHTFISFFFFGCCLICHIIHIQIRSISICIFFFSLGIYTCIPMVLFKKKNLLNYIHEYIAIQIIFCKIKKKRESKRGDMLFIIIIIAVNEICMKYC